MRAPEMGDVVLYTSFTTNGAGTGTYLVYPGMIVRVKMDGKVNLVVFNDEFADPATLVGSVPYNATPNTGGTWRFKEDK